MEKGGDYFLSGRLLNVCSLRLQCLQAQLGRLVVLQRTYPTNEKVGNIFATKN